MTAGPVVGEHEIVYVAAGDWSSLRTTAQEFWWSDTVDVTVNELLSRDLELCDSVSR